MSYKSNVKWIKKHVDNGICIDCVQAAELGKRRCKTHLDYQSEHKRKK